LKTTKISNLFFIFLIGSSVGYFGSSIYENLTSRLFSIYLNTALAILLLDLAILFWGINFKNRLKRDSKLLPVPALVAARTVALSMAASRTGALLAGFYVSVAMYFVPLLSNASIMQRFVNSIISSAVSIWLLFLGLWLERICQVPQQPDDENKSNN
jgi:hypothetical protein